MPAPVSPAQQPVTRFRDRADAGRRLAGLPDEYRGRDDVTVLALPRGGVPVASEIARHLGAPLDVFVVRKLGMPGQEEVAMGAIAAGGVTVVDRGLLDALRIPDSVVKGVIDTETAELERRERTYRGGRPPLQVTGRTVIVADDGLATGASMLAAISALRRLAPAAIVAAVPIGSAEACEALECAADRVVCVARPDPFHAVGLWYYDFTQVTDDEVRELLARRKALPEKGTHR